MTVASGPVSRQNQGPPGPSIDRGEEPPARPSPRRPRRPSAPACTCRRRRRDVSLSPLTVRIVTTRGVLRRLAVGLGELARPAVDVLVRAAALPLAEEEEHQLAVLGVAFRVRHAELRRAHVRRRRDARPVAGHAEIAGPRLRIASSRRRRARPRRRRAGPAALHACASLALRAGGGQPARMTAVTGSGAAGRVVRRRRSPRPPR